MMFVYKLPLWRKSASWRSGVCVRRGMFTYTLNNQYIITKSYIQKISSLLTQKNTVLSAYNSVLKQCFLFFLIISSTNRQIGKSPNRLIAIFLFYSFGNSFSCVFVIGFCKGESFEVGYIALVAKRLKAYSSTTH